jgi:hypothetical protein
MSRRVNEEIYVKKATGLLYDGVNGIFTRYSTAYLAIIPTDDLSTVSFALEAYYEIRVSLHIRAKNFENL